MADNGCELRGIAWKQTFPFLRLFGTFSLAKGATPMLLALASVAAVYVVGRILDRAWVSAGHGVHVRVETRQDEIVMYTQLSRADFADWQAAVRRAWSDAVVRGEAATTPRPAPRGPFIALLDYEMRCFAGAIRGVAALRWGYAGGALDERPSLLGSLASAGSGIVWLVTQRPWYALVYGLFHFAIFAFFGGAICRYAAVQIARDESVSLGEVLRFARDKYGALLAAPALPAAIFVGILVLLFLGGLVGAIPYLGEVLTGLLYGLALLAGVALALILIVMVLGLHLMWPTIAVEGSDGLDALTHAATYAGQRPWRTAFYSFVLLLYGGLAFVMVRLIAMLALKLAHFGSGLGMSIFGLVSSGKTADTPKLDALWQMPAWRDLELLPSTGAVPFWGTTWNASLDTTETIAWFLLACWLYLVVGLVGAFVVSFFFCGSTHMYFLLRREVDSTDYEELYYEEPEPAAEAAVAPPPEGAAAPAPVEPTTAPEAPAAGEGPPAAP